MSLSSRAHAYPGSMVFIPKSVLNLGVQRLTGAGGVKVVGKQQILITCVLLQTFTESLDQVQVPLNN